MLRSVVVGLDGSQDSEVAFELGLRWAARHEALLVGLTVVDEPGVHGVEEVLVGESYFRRLNEELLTQSRRRLEQALGRFSVRAAEAGVAFKPLEEVGSPCERILDVAQRYDLLMLGRRTHFRFDCEEGATDDTLEGVLRTCPRPVVVVPGTLAEGESVAIAYDGRPTSARALYALVASGLARGREVHVLSLAADPAEAARHADRATDFLALHDIRCQPHAVLTDESAGGAILEEIRPWKPGLLVVGAHGRSGLAEFFLGSTTRTFLDNSPVPVFLFH